MRLRVKHQPFVLWLPIAFVMAGCGYVNGAGSPATDDCDEEVFEEQLQPLRSAIEAEIGEAEASDVAACRTLPLGAKPCGGPWEYLVYSVEASDPSRLTDLAAEYDAVEVERNRACELASDCMMVMPPEVTLEDGRCAAAR